MRTVLFSISLLAATATPAFSQFGDEAGLSMPDTLTNPWEEITRESFSASPTLNFDLWNLTEDQAKLALYRWNIPEQARFGLSQYGIVITAPAPVVFITPNAIEESGRELEIAVSFFDAQQKPITPSHVAVYDFGQNLVDAAARPVEQTRFVIAPHLLIDRSGSMSRYWGEVETDLKPMMNLQALRKARCNLTSFNHDFENEWHAILCGTYSGLGWIGNPMGGTDIYRGLLGTYGHIETSDVDQPVVVVITDGEQETDITKEMLANAKNAPTFAYWYNDYDGDVLDNIADWEGQASEGPNKMPFSVFLKGISEAIAGQLVITVERQR